MKQMQQSQKYEFMLMSSICLTIFAANSAYSSIAPFYPNEALAKGVPPYTFGLIFACYSVAMFIASPLVNGAMNKYGRKKVMITGCLCEGIAMLAMALIDYTDSGVAFALLSALCRMVEGTGNACLNASASAIIQGEFPHKMSKFIGLQNTFIGIGMLFGPLIGSLLYMAGGFKAPFIVVGLILIVSTFVLSKVVPHETKHEIVERFNASHSIEVQNSNGKDSFWQVCSIPYISLTIIATAACEMGLVFKEPIMQLRLLHDFNLNIGIVGVIFSIDVLTFCGTCFILGRIDEKKKPFHRLIAAGLFVFSLAHLLSGPSPWIFPDSLGILITGSLLLGVGGSFIKTSSIASMHQTYTFLFGKTTPRAQNAIASVNCSGQALGQIVGPILGSFMTDWLTYRLAFFISSIMFLVFAIVFTMVTNCEEKRRRGGILDQKYTKMPSENNGVQMGEQSFDDQQ